MILPTHKRPISSDNFRAIVFQLRMRDRIPNDAEAQRGRHDVDHFRNEYMAKNYAFHQVK